MFTADLAGWLEGELPTLTDSNFSYDGTPWSDLTAPDVMVVLNVWGGPGEQWERTFDVLAMQVLARGPQRDPQGAEQLAQSIDNALMGATRVEYGDTLCISVSRTGSPPRLLQRDQARRSILTCSYLFTVARTVF